MPTSAFTYTSHMSIFSHACWIDLWPSCQTNIADTQQVYPVSPHRQLSLSATTGFWNSKPSTHLVHFVPSCFSFCVAIITAYNSLLLLAICFIFLFRC
mmetsp:Transcript_323/g.473  ORF Transcript_323/g.473 Transcript_323/m.473 type:complete len:98 (+) Transcript_323:268-561(+)